jgi:hypothetical protein
MLQLIENYKNINIKLLLDDVTSFNNILNKTSKYKCSICNKKFTNLTNMKIHINKKICKKEKKSVCLLCNKIFGLKKNYNYHIDNKVCVKKLSNINANNKIMSNNTNSNNIINNNIKNEQNNIGNQHNNIINIALNNSNEVQKVVEMLPFRNSKYDISPKKYLEYVKNPEIAIKTFIKDEHFNLKKPERMNVLDTNSRSNRINVFDYDEDFNVRWLLRSKEDIYFLLYNRGVNNLFVAKNILNTHGIKLDAITEQRLNEKIKEYENDEKSKKEQINMISDLTYNYRDMVSTNKKSNKQLLK